MTLPLGRLPTRAEIKRRPVLLACLAAGFATLVDSSLLGIVTPSLRESLGVSTSATQWILSSYSLTFGLALVPAGRLGDVFGRRQLFLGGVLVFALMSLVGGLAPAPWEIILARLLQGLGAGVISAQVLGLIQDLFDGPARARALGAYGVAGGLSGLVGPLLGAALVTLTPVGIGWRLALVANVPFAAVAFGLGVRYLPRTADRRTGVSLDPLGLTILGGATILVLLPIIWAGGSATILLVGAALCLTLFLWWERRYSAAGRTPVLLPALARSAAYLRGTLVAMFWFGAVLAQSTILTLYIIAGLGEPALVAALVVVPRSVGMIATSAVSWRLLRRFGRLTVSAGLAVQLAGSLIIALGTIHLAPLPFLWSLAMIEFVMGAAHGASEAPNRALTLSSVPTSASGLAAGFLQLSQRLTATITIAAATGIFLAADPAAGAQASAVSHGLILTVALLTLSVGVSLTEQRRRTVQAS